MRSFVLAHKFGERQTTFGKFQHTNLAQILLVKLNSEIFAKRCAPTYFCWSRKGW